MFMPPMMICSLKGSISESCYITITTLASSTFTLESINLFPSRNVREYTWAKPVSHILIPLRTYILQFRPRLWSIIIGIMAPNDNLTAVLYKTDDIRLEDQPVPKPGKGQVRPRENQPGILGEESTLYKLCNYILWFFLNEIVWN